MTRPTRHSVLGVAVSASDRAAVAEAVIAAARDHRPFGVSALAVHGVMIAVRDRQMRARINRLAVVAPDGQPVRWALRLLHGIKLPDRVYGPDLMADVCGRAETQGLSVFLFGSTKETLALLAANLRRRFPGLTFAGSQASRFRPATQEERLADLRAIADSGADIVFVGLGCPRQEVWTYENVPELSRPALAVGAAFDYHADVLKEPPVWMKRGALQWLYRLFQDPRRLWKRYLLLNPAYLGLLFLQLTRLRRFPTDDNGVVVATLRPS